MRRYSIHPVLLALAFLLRTASAGELSFSSSPHLSIPDSDTHSPSSQTVNGTDGNNQLLLRPISVKPLDAALKAPPQLPGCASQKTLKVLTMMLTVNIGTLIFTLITNTHLPDAIYLLSVSLISLQGITVLIPTVILITIALITHRSGLTTKLGTFLALAINKAGLEPLISFTSSVYSSSPASRGMWSLGKRFIIFNLEGLLIFADALTWLISCGTINILSNTKTTMQSNDEVLINDPGSIDN